MKIKSFKNAKELIGRLDKLDREIKEIQEAAESLNDGPDELKISLKHNISEAAQPKERFAFSFLWPPDRENPFNETWPVKVPRREVTDLIISDVMALQVLGVIVAHKENERMSIVNQLYAMGIEVEL